MKKIEIEINNHKKLSLTQLKSKEILLETISSNGTILSGEIIKEEDFIMLLNYYRHIKNKDIKDEFINSNGINNEENLEHKNINF